MLLKNRNWVYRRISDISEKIIAGGDKPKVFSEMMTDECYIPVYANGVYNNGLCGYTTIPIVKDECITISARGTIGFCCVRTTPFTPIVRLIVVIPKSFISNKFLCYALSNLNIEKNGGTIPQLTVPMIKEYTIPVPSIEEQSRIVEELDQLSSIIEKKRQQLSELDNLAQSIFYDMFGDPVTNEKGWEVKKLGDICDISSSKRIYANEYCEEGVPFYRGKEITEKSKGNEISVELFISTKKYEELKVKFGVPKIGDILITAVGTIGNIWVVNTDEPFYFKDGNVLWLQLKSDIISEYFKFLLEILIDKHKTSMANGCAYSALTIINLREMATNLIPLNLQQLFAQQIEAIEKEKELIKQSIKETEELFNSRMDYYFG
ncbi:MAG: restriction endonuclease subunit S [Bacteroides sp.]|nr:restriction endonuclease subunit S [Bacteroides sp.]